MFKYIKIENVDILYFERYKSYLTVVPELHALLFLKREKLLLLRYTLEISCKPFNGRIKYSPILKKVNTYAYYILSVPTSCTTADSFHNITYRRYENCTIVIPC